MSSVTLNPGIGIGVLTLDSSLYEIVNHFKKTQNSLKIVYSKDELFETPIIVYLKDLGIRLVFDSLNQSLILIEVIEFNLLLNYNNNTINQKASPTFKEIYNKFFGPTIPGKLYFDKKRYVLNYPGISFKFELSNEILSNYSKDLNAKDNENLMEFLSKSSINCESLVIYQIENGINWVDYFNNLNLTIFNNPESKKSKWNRSIKLKANNNRKITLAEINLSKGLIKMNFNDKSNFIIEIGKTKQQSVLRKFGEPDSTFLKNDKRFKINEIHNDGEIFENFHNYFKFGFDILYDTNNKTGAIVKKIIIHNNLPNEVLFNQYNKLNWIMKGYEIVPKKEELLENDKNSNIFLPSFIREKINKEIFEDWHWTNLRDNDDFEFATSEMYFNKLSSNHFKTLKILKNQEITNYSFNPSRFVLIDRNNFDDDNDDLIDYYENIQNKWGQSKIFGFNRCIWEILTENNAISNITLF